MYSKSVREMQRRAGIQPESLLKKMQRRIRKIQKDISHLFFIAWIFILIGWYRLWGKEIPK